jgi:2OG-Fe(II) oxygenase superfamily
MITEAVLNDAARYREAFQTAQPFKYVCIDEFFTPDWAEAALRDFPAFDPQYAIGDNGEIGGKAVVSNICEISPFYAKLYEYFMSRGFLDGMSAITGIENLQGDPTLYGGGTHENLNGQTLDVHVDFNFQIGEGFHRRANLLLYLNKEWDPAWGGAIELHSNPRRPDLDEFEQFNVIFNRAVIFETNEYSWHGFRKIRLPEDRIHLSRKCLSIYLYTPDRPAHEIAGPHSTFYVQWPLPDAFKPGRVLSEADVKELQEAYNRRDGQIEMYQRMEERLGRELEGLRRYLGEVIAAIKAPIVGYAQQLGNSSGLFHDGWVARDVSLQLRAQRPVTGITVKGFVPENFPAVARAFAVEIDGKAFDFSLGRDGGSFEFSCPTEIAGGAIFQLRMRCSSDFNASAAGQGADQRDLAYGLSAIELSHDPIETAKRAKRGAG